MPPLDRSRASGGDEFALILPLVELALAEPIMLDGVQAQADVGMYEAKRTHAEHRVYAATHDWGR